MGFIVTKVLCTQASKALTVPYGQVPTGEEKVQKEASFKLLDLPHYSGLSQGNEGSYGKITLTSDIPFPAEFQVGAVYSVTFIEGAPPRYIAPAPADDDDDDDE